MSKKVSQTAEEFLKSRLLINDDGSVFTPFDELVSFVRMFAKIKCEEQRYNCAMGIDYIWEPDTAELTGVASGMLKYFNTSSLTI